MNRISFSDVNPILNSDKKFIKKSIEKIIDKKNFILGDEVKIFEDNFAKKAKRKYAVGCATGTDALILSLMSLNLKKNDEVIVPGMTYISTGLAVILNNKKLILSDIDLETGLIDINKIKEKITKKTKAIIPVNLYGQKVNLKKLRNVIGKRIHIIEDSAQSHFAFDSNKNKITSTNISIASCYSFYPAKNLGAYGDGGIITTNDKYTYKRLLALRNLGSVQKYKHYVIGMNSRLDTVQAVVLNHKLKSIFKLNNIRRKLGLRYDKLLNSVKGVKITKTNKGSSRHLYVIRTKKRDNLIKYLLKKKISCQIHYPYSLNKLEAFKNKTKKISLQNSELWAAECLSLPMHPNMTFHEVDKVVKEIKNYFKYIQ